MAAGGGPDPTSKPSRRAGWRGAFDGLPPRAAEVALATVLGGGALACANALAIALALPSHGGWLRALHHAYAAICIVGVAAWLAAPMAGAARLGPWLASRLPAVRWTLFGWLGSCGVATLAMHALMAANLRRQADAAFDGDGATLLFPLYLVLCGLSVPAAHLLGAGFARLGRFGIGVGVGLGLAGIVTGHVLLRDDYPGVHVAILWVSAVVVGGTLAPSWRWRRAPVIVLATFCGFVCVVFAPPNRVRRQLFREPGSVAPYVLARAVWRLPEVDRVEPAPRVTHDVEPDDVVGIASDPIVVMVSIDAVRADVIADRDNDRLFSTLSELRDSGAYFERAVAPGSQTSVSLTTAFAGRYFSQMLWQYYGSGTARFHYAAADPTERFVAALTRGGVPTTSSLGLIFLGGDYGVARGFSDEHVVVEGREHAQAATVLVPLLDELRRIKRGPHFFYAHLMEPHAPYDRGRKVDGPEFERYLSEVQVADGWIAKIWQVLRRRHKGRGYLIVTADHGEAFGEHGTTRHTKTLYEELLRVPLIIAGPGIEPRHLQQRVSMIDIGPTVLQMFRLPRQDHAMGHSLLPLMRGRLAELPRPVFAEGRLKRAYYKGELKVIEDLRRKTLEVYDLRADPGELNNLFDDAVASPDHPRHDQVAVAVAEMRAFFWQQTLRQPAGYEPPFKP